MLEVETMVNNADVHRFSIYNAMHNFSALYNIRSNPLLQDVAI